MGTKISVTTNRILSPILSTGSAGTTPTKDRGDDVTIASSSPSVLTLASQSVIDSKAPVYTASEKLRDAERLRQAELERLAQEELRRIKQEDEAKRKELSQKEKAKQQKQLNDARQREQENPLCLSELFRFMLFFVNEQLVDDPDESQQGSFQLPHPRGLWANKMLTAIYQNYCSSSGFMTFSDLCDFLEDSGITSTHVPR